MRGLYLRDRRLSYREDLHAPDPAPGTTRVRVLRAGICATDLALARGYMGFEGTPGHEFVGEALDGPLRGRRVVGEINAACGACDLCRAGLERHCPHRTVLGILRHGGAFAEQIALPTANLHAVPETVSTDAATFTEPLAAAFEIGEQLALPRGEGALVAGDGKLGLLCAHALHLAGMRVTVAGRHPERRELLPPGVPLATDLLEGDRSAHGSFALAIEATGRADVLPRLLLAVRPRGTIVLKTTIELPIPLDTSIAVVNELTLVGSRCGPFGPALRALAAGLVPVERLVQARYPLAHGEAAFAHAARRGTLKVLIDVAED
jgi:threonine dehydrogenase-like Zn-dependent dehydrogenase